MNYSTFEAILTLNKNFYDTVFEDFNNTRFLTWPAFEQIIKLVRVENGDRLKILDMACGNGRFINDLEKAKVDYNYLGLDANAGLLSIAKKKYRSRQIKFKMFDIVNDFLDLNDSFNLIVCFGITHHLPSKEFRFKFLDDLVNLLDSNAMLVLSFFDFLEDPRFVKKIIPESDANKLYNAISGKQLEKFDLEENDYFLGWSTKKVVRYCHYYPLK